MATKLGEALVFIRGDVQDLNKKLGQAERGVGRTMGNVLNQTRKIGLAMTGFGVAVGGTLFKAVNEWAAYGDEIGKAAKRTGVSTEAMSVLGHAADQTGASMSDIEKAVKKMARTIKDSGDEGQLGLEKYTKSLMRAESAVEKQRQKIEELTAAGKDTTAAQRSYNEAINKLQAIQTEGVKATGTNIEAINELGLSYVQLLKLKPEEQFKLISESLSKVENATLQSALAQEIFGRSGTQLIPLINEGAAGLEAYATEAEKLGLVIDTESAAAAEKFVDTMDELSKAFRGAMIVIGPLIAENLMPLAEAVRDNVAEWSAWMKDNPLIVGGAIKLAAALAGISLVLGPILIALKPIISTFLALKTVFLWFSGAKGAAAVATATTQVATATTAATTATVASTAALAAWVALIGIAVIALAGIAIATKKWWEAKQNLKETTEQENKTNERAIQILEDKGVAIDRVAFAEMSLADQQTFLAGKFKEVRDAAVESNEEMVASTESSVDAMVGIQVDGLLAVQDITGQAHNANMLWSPGTEGSPSGVSMTAESLNMIIQLNMDAANTLQNILGGIHDAFINTWRGIADFVGAALQNIMNATQNVIGGAGNLLGFADGGVIPGYANGGLTQQRIVMVGERGPEPVALPVGSRVMSNSDMKSAVGGGGGINFNGPLIGNATISNNMDIATVASELGSALAANLSQRGLSTAAVMP